ncbi:hypothetical protein [Pseudomonas sp. PNPG3]|uniref:hypothetical protein n=1 Tax=Pseudomonas sp. PNPG3 TaxID=2919497 RepID=UPI001FFCD694|nr:hypothetical protein [Pseudomonas sp. PNPG3]
MSTESQYPSYKQLVQYRRDTNPEPARRHRTTIYRAAQRLIAQAEGSSGGIWWTPEQIAAWHPQDFEALCDRVGAAGVQGLDAFGELNFGVEN